MSKFLISKNKLRLKDLERSNNITGEVTYM